jgi:hypothetical protein
MAKAKCIARTRKLERVKYHEIRKPTEWKSPWVKENGDTTSTFHSAKVQIMLPRVLRQPIMKSRLWIMIGEARLLMVV